MKTWYRWAAVCCVLFLALNAASVRGDGLLTWPAPWEAKPTPRNCMMPSPPPVTPVLGNSTINLTWNQTVYYGPENITVYFSPDGDAYNASWTLLWEYPLQPGYNMLPAVWLPSMHCPAIGRNGAPGCTLVLVTSRGFHSCAQITLFSDVSPPYSEFAPSSSPQPWWQPQPWWNPPSSWYPPQSWTPQPWYSSPSSAPTSYAPYSYSYPPYSMYPPPPSSYTPYPYVGPSSYTPYPYTSPSSYTPYPYYSPPSGWNSPSGSSSPLPYWNPYPWQPPPSSWTPTSSWNPVPYYTPVGWQPPVPIDDRSNGICRRFDEINVDLSSVSWNWPYATVVNDTMGLFSFVFDPCARTMDNSLLINNDYGKLSGPVAHSNDTIYYGGAHGQVLIRYMNFNQHFCMQALHRPALLNLWLRCGQSTFTLESVDATKFAPSCEVSLYISSSLVCGVTKAP